MNGPANEAADAAPGSAADEERAKWFPLMLVAAELVDAIVDQAARDRENYEAGYRAAARDFFDHGYEVGYGHAQEEMAEQWSRVHRTVQEHARTPTHAELQAARRAGVPERPALAAAADRGADPAEESEESSPDSGQQARVIELRRGVA
ncbi:hypothetical protein [Streptosporangium sp. NPDC051022]|uniref:hypothetical protein n=1 Tax=Streptosporangium sp. NPDC051022 TaxID=3155752 RepID=UPI003412190F